MWTVQVPSFCSSAGLERFTNMPYTMRRMLRLALPWCQWVTLKLSVFHVRQKLWTYENVYLQNLKQLMWLQRLIETQITGKKKMISCLCMKLGSNPSKICMIWEVVDSSLHLQGPWCLCTLNISITKEELGLEKCASFLNLSPALLEWAWQWIQFSSSVLILSVFGRIYFLCSHKWIPTFGNVATFFVEKIQPKVCDKSGPFPHTEKQRSLCKAFTCTEHYIS